MKNNIIIAIAITIMLVTYKLSLLGYNQYYYLQNSENPSYRTENNSNRQDVTNAIPFTLTDISGININDFESKNQNLTGYFWDSKNTDNTLLFPGKARIGNDQYINVVAVDSKKIDPNYSSYEVRTINAANFIDLHQQNNKIFKPNALIKIGTFMKKNDPVIYYVYGAYLSTIIPDSTVVEVL